MLVVYTFCAVMGAVFAALSWLRVAAAPTHPPEDEVSARPRDPRRLWALPLCFFGLVGVTLTLLERPLVHTLGLSLAVGPVVGLVAGWVSGRISDAGSGTEGAPGPDLSE
jgi:hypothetical protein